MEFLFSPSTICAQIPEAKGGDRGEGGSSAVGPADGARGARGQKGFGDKYL